MTTPFTTNFAKPLTDGSVMIIQKQPYKLAGTWKALAPIPTDYASDWFSPAVLTDGRVAIAGGGYGVLKPPKQRFTTQCTSPPYCQDIGDSPSLLLADGCKMICRLLAVQRWSYLG